MSAKVANELVVIDATGTTATGGTGITFASGTLSFGTAVSGEGASRTISGQAGASGNNRGGDLLLSGGAKTGSGNNGGVYIYNGSVLSASHNGGAHRFYTLDGANSIFDVFTYLIQGKAPFLPGTGSGCLDNSSASGVVGFKSQWNVGVGTGAIIVGSPAVGTAGLTINTIVSQTAVAWRVRNASDTGDVANCDASGSINGNIITAGSSFIKGSNINIGTNDGYWTGPNSFYGFRATSGGSIDTAITRSSAAVLKVTDGSSGTGQLLSKGLVLETLAAASAANGTIFRDSSNSDKLSYKDGSGTTKEIVLL